MTAIHPGFDASSGLEPPRQRTAGAVPDAVGRTLAIVAILAAGSGVQLTHNLSLAVVVACGISPLALPALARFTGARPVVGVAVLALVSGWALRVGAADADLIYGSVASDTALRFVTGIAVLIVVLWGRTMVPLWQVGTAYGVGALGRALVTPAAFSDIGFKFYLAVPLAVIALSLCDARQRRVAAALIVTFLGLIGIVDDARSFLGFCLVTALLLGFLIIRGPGARMASWTPAIMLATLSVAVYLVVSQLMQIGVFGVELQQKAQQQIAAGGSLIAGGRPEWAATAQLMQVHPWGYGLGVLPSYAEVLDAKRGLADVGLPIANNGYVNRFMFGDSLNLHSVIADLWGQFGIVGLLLALMVTALIVANLSRGLADRTAGGLVIFTAVIALWYLAFGPLYSNWQDVCLALGVALAFRSHRQRAPAPSVAGPDPGAPTTS